LKQRKRKKYAPVNRLSFLQTISFIVATTGYTGEIS
jgi:hypothetical protein